MLFLAISHAAKVSITVVVIVLLVLAVLYIGLGTVFFFIVLAGALSLWRITPLWRLDRAERLIAFQPPVQPYTS